MGIDKEHIWHPYTSLTKPLPGYAVSHADGVHIHLENGTSLIDGMSSWWACVHGYNHPALNEAAKSQIDKMSHVMFGGLTHQPAIELTQSLLAIVPKGLENVFYSDSGSVSVEVAMKMALQYQVASGNKSKNKFLTARFGYHGDTTGAMSVCDHVSGMHNLFAGFLPQHIFCPELPLGYTQDLDQNVLDSYCDLFEIHHSEIAAFILEPVVQGAGGMRIYNPEYLSHIKALCEKFDILFIADEIATGFGRTGKPFGCSHANLVPDIMCLGKALSGGFMTFAATMSTGKVAEVISNNPPFVFMHGPTFMGNPLACAVSAASIEILKSTKHLQLVKNIENILSKNLSNIPNSIDIRILGAIGIVEFDKQIDVEESQKFFVGKGVWIRPLEI